MPSYFFYLLNNHAHRFFIYFFIDINLFTSLFLTFFLFSLLLLTSYVRVEFEFLSTLKNGHNYGIRKKNKKKEIHVGFTALTLTSTLLHTKKNVGEMLRLINIHVIMLLY